MTLGRSHIAEKEQESEMTLGRSHIAEKEQCQFQ
jgi:hypothetical protein